jgi:hypothetical protein
MALHTVAFNTEGNLAVVASSAGLVLLHLLHSNFFVLFTVRKGLVVAGAALLSGA